MPISNIWYYDDYEPHSWKTELHTAPVPTAAQGTTSPHGPMEGSIASAAVTTHGPVPPPGSITYNQFIEWAWELKEAYLTQPWPTQHYVPVFLYPSSIGSPNTVLMSQQQYDVVSNIPPPPTPSSSNMATKKTKSSALKQGTLTLTGQVNASTIQPVAATKSSTSTKKKPHTGLTATVNNQIWFTFDDLTPPMEAGTTSAVFPGSL